jgi:hypothetical protein
MQLLHKKQITMLLDIANNETKLKRKVKSYSGY